MSHSHNSDNSNSSKPELQPKNAPAAKEQSVDSVGGWTDPAYSVALGSFKHLFMKHKELQSKRRDQSATGAVPPNTVTSSNNQNTTQQKNQAGESAKSAGEIMINNSNTNNVPNYKPSSVEQIETESHGLRDIVFSENFKFKATLLSIFWKIDQDEDERLSKQALSDAISKGQFHGDEELILCLLWRHFDDIRRRKIMASTFFDRRGISIEEIEAFEGWSRYLPQSAINQNNNSMPTGPKTFRKSPSTNRPQGK